MVRQIKTDAESCWDDESVASDEQCEKYLQRKQKVTATADADEAEEDDAAEEDEENEDAEATEAEALGTDPEDDSEDDEEDEEAEAESTSDDNLEEASSAEAPNPRGKKMAKKSASGSKTKADHIREIIAAKQAAGVDLRPRDIIAALEKRGVEVNASQVSITMRAMGIPPLRKGGGAKPKAKTAASAAEAPTEQRRATLKRAAPVSESSPNGEIRAMDEQLEAAADFIHGVGGYERALSLLNLCNKVSQRV